MIRHQQTPDNTKARSPAEQNCPCFLVRMLALISHLSITLSSCMRKRAESSFL